MSTNEINILIAHGRAYIQPLRKLLRVLWIMPLLVACHQQAPTATETSSPAETALAHADKHLDSRYVCPMHPKIIKQEAANCPICGMALVEKKIDLTMETHPVVTLSSTVTQNMGVRTGQVARGELWKYISTVGQVTYNEDRINTIKMHVKGWIENVAVRVNGMRVKKGQLLFEVYSPEFNQAQKDFLAAQKKDQSSINKHYSQRKESNEARERLRFMQVSDSMINSIARRGKPYFRIPVYAKQLGTVVMHNASAGKYVYPYEELMTIVDTTTVWVDAKVYSHQLEWLSLGLKAQIEVDALPGRVFKGEVNFIYPELEPASRTLRVRLRIPNPDELLKPNMFAYVSIYGGPKKNVLKIPREALIATGERESVVLDLGDGKFQPVDVVSGMQSQGEVEILSGLKDGDKIVLSGQFLIDSESNLQASFNRLNHSE